MGGNAQQTRRCAHGLWRARCVAADQQCGIAAARIAAPLVSISFKRRDTRSVMVVVNPIFWQVWRPKSAVHAYGAGKGAPRERMLKAAVSWGGMRPVQGQR